MTTPYLGLDDTSNGQFELKRLNDNTTKIEKALHYRRMDLPDRVQIGATWITQPAGAKDWLIHREDLSGNKVIRHGIWAMVEIQFIATKDIKINSSGNITNLHIATLRTGYIPKCRIGLTALNSNLDAVLEIRTNGYCYLTAFNHTSTTIPKGTILRIGGRYVYNP